MVSYWPSPILSHSDPRPRSCFTQSASAPVCCREPPPQPLGTAYSRVSPSLPPCKRHTELRPHLAVLRTPCSVTQRYSLALCQTEPSPLLCHTSLSRIYASLESLPTRVTLAPTPSVTLSLSSAACNTEPPHFYVRPSPSSTRFSRQSLPGS